MDKAVHICAWSCLVATHPKNPKMSLLSRGRESNAWIVKGMHRLQKIGGRLVGAFGVHRALHRQVMLGAVVKKCWQDDAWCFKDSAKASLWCATQG